MSRKDLKLKKHFFLKRVIDGRWSAEEEFVGAELKPWEPNCMLEKGFQQRMMVDKLQD